MRAVTPSSRPISSVILPFSIRSTLVPVNRIFLPVAAGKDPAKVAERILQTELACEVLDEFAEDERDEMFWEESSGLFYAAALLQIEHDVLKPKTRTLALQAISHEKAHGVEGERLKLLSELEKRLRQK